jgi:hydroxypyruvate isomerase
MEGELAQTLRSHIEQIKHIQIADNPGRHEPGTGEINYSWLLAVIDALPYDGYIGCEYKPLTDTKTGLSWMKNFIE